MPEISPRQGNIPEEEARLFSSGYALGGIAAIGSRFENPSPGEFIEALDQSESAGVITPLEADGGRDYALLLSMVQGLYEKYEQDYDGDPQDMVSQELILEEKPDFLIEELDQGGYIVYAVSNDPELNGSEADFDYRLYISKEQEEHAIVQATLMGVKLPERDEPVDIPLAYGADDSNYFDVLTEAFDMRDRGALSEEDFKDIEAVLGHVRLHKEQLADYYEVVTDPNTNKESARFFTRRKDSDNG